MKHWGSTMADHLFMPNLPSHQMGLNISDIIDVIQDDKDYGETEMMGYAGGGTPSEANCSAASSSLSRNDPDIEQKRQAYVQIIEQPQPKALRFRYICEGRSAGSIPGVRSMSENKTFPTIKIMKYKGPAVVVVSCVTVDPPYRPHPHNLVGKEGCSKGVCTVTVDNDSMECMFSNLGIQCVKKKDVEQALRLREEIRVDPFGTGFAHRSQPQSIDLNAVRLCFQVFLKSSSGGRFTYPLKPVVSDAIFDKKATSDLNICKLSDCTSSVAGNKEIILLCDKVTKEDIQVRFYEVKDGRIEWEAFGDFQASDVHKQVAISFKTPKYKNLEIENSVKVFIQLQRPSDKNTSEPRPFEYLPMDADHGKRKIRKENDTYIDRFFADVRLRQTLGATGGSIDIPTINVPRPMKVALRPSRLPDDIKMEPPDSIPLSPSPEPRGIGLMPVRAAISPQHNGGGLLYQPISPIPPSHPHPLIQGHPVYYTSPSPVGSVVGMSAHSPYSNLSPGIPYDPYPSPYSPVLPPGAAGYTPSTIIGVASPGRDDSMNMGHESPELPHYTNMNAAKPEVDNNLPDLGVINSSELSTIDNFSMNNLSASLNNSLNLADMPSSMNHLDKKSDEDKRNLNTPVNDNFLSNIPLNIANDTMKNESDESVPSATSDSLKNLRMDLETFNKLTERS